MSVAQTSPTSRLGAARTSLRNSLFAPGEIEDWRLSRVEASIVLVSLLALAIVLALLRIGWTSALETIWAEDGPIYLQGALTLDFWHAVFEPYAGYLVVGPRMIAELASLFPLQYAAAALSITSSAVAALSALAVWHGATGLVRNPYLRGALALTLLLAPTAGLESLDSAAYVPWYMLVGTFWLLFFRARTTWGAGLAGFFALLTGLSTPGVWFFLPVAALRALTARDRRDALLLSGYAIGAAVQVPVILSQEQGEALWTAKIWTALVQRVVDGAIFGQELGGALWASLGWPFLIALVVLLLLGLATGLRQAPAGTRWFVAVAVPTSVAMFVISAYQRTVGPDLIWQAGNWGGVASRYVLVPALLLLSAVIVTIDAAIRRRSASRWSSWAVGATVATMLLAIATSFDMSEQGRAAPLWKDALRQAAATCVSEGEETADIPTSPEPFGVQVPCEQVASFAPPGLSRR